MDMIENDWIFGLIGGLMIGAASAFYLFFNGRVAGVSGVLGTLIESPIAESSRGKLAFVAGIIIAPAIALYSGFDAEVTVTNHLPTIIIGGLLVGFGTRLGSGCTSGHGVCGMSRLSVRSITATCTFMVCAAITVYITRHLMGA